MGSWAGTGPIVTGSCSMAAWSLFDLSTAYLWAPVIGCLQGRPDCCPSSFIFASMTAPPPSVKTEAISVTRTSSASKPANDTWITAPTSLAPGAVPTLSASDSTSSRLNPCLIQLYDAGAPLCFQPLKTPGAALMARDNATPQGVSNCPEDYSSVGKTGCCPYGMTPTSTLGIIPACATRLPSPFPAPRVQVTALSSDKPISTATDVIYALQYQIYTIEYNPQPTSEQSSGLSTGAKAGIGAGCGFLAVVLLGALVFFISRRRRIKLGIQERGRSGNSERATTIVGGSYLDPEGNEKKDNEPVVGGRAELGVQDAQVDVQRYELPAADAVVPLTPSGVYVMVPTPTPTGQEGVYQYQQQESTPQQQPYGCYQIHH